MSKRKLSRQQRWRIEKVQAERAERATRHDVQEEVLLAAGDYGAEQPGRVMAHFGRTLDVRSDVDGESVRCHLRANLEGLVTGDRVVWRGRTDAEGHIVEGVVVARGERESVLERPDARHQLKPVAANIDQILIVFAVEPEPHANLIDRYLVAAEHAGIRPLLLLNKFDLIDEQNAPALNAMLAVYRQLGYPVLEVSAHHGNGMEQLQQQLDGRISVFVGQSGVGKSSLVNSLLPEVETRVGPLSELSGQGTHTTTTARLFHFPGGGELIDSPGIREFGLGHVSRSDVEAGFIEFNDLIGTCRFRDCKHDREPGCALLKALEDGRVQQQRMNSYRSIIASLPQDTY